MTERNGPLEPFRLFAEYDDDDDDTEDEQSKLFIQGYSCNIYQDSQKYIDINSDKYLIPWAADQDVLIDRFDVRGCLSDNPAALLTVRTSQSRGGNAVAADDEDVQLQAELDKERYQELDENWQHMQLLEEEHQKRQSVATKSSSIAGNGAAFHQVAFSYGGDDSNGSGASATDSSDPTTRVQTLPSEAAAATPDDEEDAANGAADEPFALPLGLDVPRDMRLPSSRRQGAIIDKTAQFLARHGPQMEIVLKTKQSGNASFQFLSYGNELYNYYRLVLDAIRQGRYVPLATPKPMNLAPEHHLSSSAPSIDVQQQLPKVSTAGTSYAKLLEQFRQRQQEQEEEMLKQQLQQQHQRLPPPPPPPPPQPSSSPVPAAAPAPAPAPSPAPDPIEPDSEELRLIIDKLAAYVQRNGTDFEAVVRARNDLRFEFLKPEHRFHPYYLMRCGRIEDCQRVMTQQAERQRELQAESSLAPSGSGLVASPTAASPAEENYIRKQLERKRKAMAFLARVGGTGVSNSSSASSSAAAAAAASVDSDCFPDAPTKRSNSQTFD